MIVWMKLSKDRFTIDSHVKNVFFLNFNSSPEKIIERKPWIEY
jgi:hypothetical protein